MQGKIKTRNLRQQVIIERKRRTCIFFALILLAFLCISLMFFGEKGLIKYDDLKKKTDNLDAELTLIEKDNKLLKSQVEALRKDPFFIEKYAREEYGLAKPEEYIFQFQDDGR